MDHEPQVPPMALKTALDALYAAQPPVESTARAHARLNEALAEAQRAAILYGSLGHPTVETLYLAIRNGGLIAVNFGISEEEFLTQVEKRFGFMPYYAQKEVSPFTRQIRAYLNGERMTFDLTVDLSRLTNFQRRVLSATRQIPSGSVVTYGDIARTIGKPKAARAVGQALGHNPIPIVIPCHRVIASDRSLGGYSSGGGLETKVKLLQLEGAVLDDYR